MQNTAIFPLFYLPNLSYFSTLKSLNFDFTLEKEEFFPKQTFRNRASILSPNGPLTLTIPVIKGSKVHTKYKDVKISYDQKWQRLHKLCLQNCYRSSAYFEYYEDDILPFYEKRYEFLFDYNLEWLEFIFKQLKIKADFKFTDSYDREVQNDYRNLFSKSANPINTQQSQNKVIYPSLSYFQVFNDRIPFQANLSILDLIFNQGPQAKNFL